jgi:hypothetical protein
MQVGTLALAILAKALWKVKEALHLRKEALLCSIIIGILGGYLLAIGLTIQRLLDYPNFLFIHFLGILVPGLQFIIAPFYSRLLYKIYQERKKADENKAATRLQPPDPARFTGDSFPETTTNEKLPETVQELTIMLVLKNRHMRTAFEEHLKLEFSAENLYLWRCTQHWFNLYSNVEILFEEKNPETHNVGTVEAREHAVETARKLFSDFVTEGAPLMVNISSKRRKSMESFFQSQMAEKAQEDKSIYESLLDELKELEVEVISTMNDAFYRFIMTPECSQALDSALNLGMMSMRLKSEITEN